jgi:hypothetical protein
MNDQIPQRAFYAIIPAGVRYCKDLEPNAKLFYGELTALANEYGYCWASNEYFAELYGVTTRVIQYWLESLKKHGFIKVQISKKGIKTSRKIWITPDVQKMFAKGQKCPDDNENDDSQKMFATRKNLHGRHEKNFVEGTPSPYIYNNTTNDISPLTSPQKSSPELLHKPSPEAQELSEKLKQEISYVNPHFNDSTLNWPKIFDQLLKKKSFSHLTALICWIFKDDFWKSVIVSPSGIKKNIAKLESKMEIEKCNLKAMKNNYSKEAMPFSEEPTTSRKPTSVRATRTPEDAQLTRAFIAKMSKEYGLG